MNETTMNKRLVLLTLLLLPIKATTCLKFITLNVPGHVETGKSITMECLYEMGKDELYSVKWYKDNNEFYQYLPKNKPPGQIFNMTGVHVNQSSSTNHLVVLDNVELESAGRYRCEVSAEGTFKTVERESEMNVYDVPDGDPQISGGLSKYNIGDTVNVNCSTVGSKPAAELEWHINGEKANQDILCKYPIKTDHAGLETATLGLQFEVEERHFVNGEMNLKCTASINYVYLKSHAQAITRNQVQASQYESNKEMSQVLHNSANVSASRLQRLFSLWFSYFFVAALEFLR